MRLQFTKRARLEFLRIVDVYAEYAGQRYADRFIDKVDGCIKDIILFPTANHPETLLSDRKFLYRAKTINDNYRIIYHVTSATIWIDDIWDRRCNPAKLTKRIG